MNDIADFFTKLFDASDWPPRWHCGQWTAFHGWLYIISDLLIWSSYFSIPLVIIKYISRKQEVRFVKLYFLFAGFILACGATHFLDAIAFWIPVYRLNGLVRLITGVLSWATVFYLIRFLPVAFSLKSQQELEIEIEQRRKAEAQVRELNGALEQRVLERTDQLYKSEQKYRHLFENNPMPMWIIALPSFRFLDVNEAAVVNYGYSCEEFLSMTALDIRPEEEVERYKNAHHPSTLDPYQYNRGQWRHRKKDGTIIHVEIIAHDIVFEGQPARFILSNDITARVLAERSLRDSLQEISAYKEELHTLNMELEDRIRLRTAQLEAANKEMEAFSYSVSHDLRAPLRGIIGFTTILEEDYSAKLDDEARRITGVIKKNTIKMGQLIDGLLTFSRTTRQDVVKAAVNTQQMVSTVIEELATGDNVTWLVHDLPDVQAEFNTLRQVWINLLSNAVKYSSKTTQPRIEIGSFPQEGQIVFFVKDNGVGFDNKYKNKLFGVFQRLHRADEFEGTGVGLAMVDKIISKHGGKVWADAVLQEGASFYFSLPDH